MKRRISHAEPMRSTPGRGRVTHRRSLVGGASAAARPRGGVPLGRGRASAPRAAPAARPRGRARRCRRSRCARGPTGVRGRRRAADATAGARVPRGVARAVSRVSTLFDLARRARRSLLTRAAELLDQRVVRPRIDAVGGKHARVAAGAFDLGLQPLEVFARRKACPAARRPPASPAPRQAAAAAARSARAGWTASAATGARTAASGASFACATGGATGSRPGAARVGMGIGVTM